MHITVASILHCMGYVWMDPDRFVLEFILHVGLMVAFSLAAAWFGTETAGSAGPDR
jgi:hypothetical protein